MDIVVRDSFDEPRKWKKPKIDSPLNKPLFYDAFDRSRRKLPGEALSIFLVR